MISATFESTPVEASSELQARRDFNAQAEANPHPLWYDYPNGVEAYRQGLHAATPTLDSRAVTLKCPSHYSSRDIFLRVFHPETGTNRGIFLHFHSGGWVLGEVSSQDAYLVQLADSLSLTVVSVEYRLAPRDIFPALTDDCVSAALYALSKGGQKSIGSSPLLVMGGESAGANLAITTIFRLRDEHKFQPQDVVKVLALSYGMYDLSLSPSAHSCKRNLIVGRKDLEMFTSTYVPSQVHINLKDKLVSPMYQTDFSGLLPAVFLVGSEDILLDDTLLMMAKWSVGGSKAVLRVFEEATHAFTIMPAGKVASEGVQFLIAALADVLEESSATDCIMGKHELR